MRLGGLVLALVLGGSAGATAQPPDPDLVRFIDAIPAIDDHAHVPDVVREHDKGYDQLRCDELESPDMPDPAMVRFSPMQQDVYESLYGWRPQPGSQEDMRRIAERRLAARTKEGRDLYARVLTTADIDRVVANRVDFPADFPAGRFVWVPYVDALVIPLDNRLQKRSNPDRRVFYADAEGLLDAYLRDAGLARPPATLDEYLQRVVRPVLRRQRAAGAVAVKFEAAYLRSLSFAEASRSEASAVYARYVRGGAASAKAYKTLQDFIFGQIALQASRL